MLAETSIRQQFLDYVFNGNEGYVCIATQDPKKDDFKQSFFRWPQQKKEIVAYVAASSPRKNVWFGVNLLTKSERRKEWCLPTNLVWADLDEIDPDTIDPKPPIVIESSPGRFQALWRLDQIVDPQVAEDYSKRIAYSVGADKSGWDLTQLLRVPLTYNFKYEIEGQEVPEVKLIRGLQTVVPAQIFEALPKPPQAVDPVLEQDIPDDLPNADAVMYKYWMELRDTAFSKLHENIPDDKDDWSGLLWREINICLEAGMDAVEVFAVVLESKCNKYERDNRPARYLWRDVLKAEAQQNRTPQFADDFVPLTMPELVSDGEAKTLPKTFVEEYVEWATVQTDAVSEFHELTAFILLSSILASGLKLNTTYGTMIPNLWGLVLGESTLTRKTTAMSMAMSMLGEIDEELVLATDGSAEGLLTGLATRPNRVSLFYKDEVSGFFDSINRKDYLAGMPETLTQLYDVPPFYTRRLRKETISIVKPVFIFFGGGIREKVYQLVSEEYVLSGFLPRFLIVSGEADISQVRRTGPATQKGDLRRGTLKAALERLHELYVREETMKIGGQTASVVSVTEVFLTDGAWNRYGDIEMEMAKVASESPVSMLALPTFERLSRSILKMSMLLAAASREPENRNLFVQESDIVAAARYVQKWGKYSIDLILNAGLGMYEGTLKKVLRSIQRNPGIHRSTIMRNHHLSRRDMDEAIGTLEDRGHIRVEKKGKLQQIWAL